MGVQTLARGALKHCPTSTWASLKKIISTAYSMIIYHISIENRLPSYEKQNSISSILTLPILTYPYTLFRQ